MVRDGSAGAGVVGVVEALDQTWFGAALGPETQARLAGHRADRTRAGGTVLLREGEPTDDMSIVMTGRVALRMLVPERGMVTILTVEPGDVVGWSALLSPHRATCRRRRGRGHRAPGASTVTDLRAMLRADHALAANVYPRVLQAVARRLAATRVPAARPLRQGIVAEVNPW